MQMQIMVSTLQFLVVTSAGPPILQLMLSRITLRLIHFRLPQPHVFLLLLWRVLEAFENIVLLLSDMFWKALGNNCVRGSNCSITQYVLILSLFQVTIKASVKATFLHPWWFTGINSCKKRNHVVAPRA